MMQQALKEAKKGEKKNTVPIGAIIELNGKIIARAHNDPFWHAEILCIKKAQEKIRRNSKLNNETNCSLLKNASIYITVEPCAMCLHAIKLARIGKIFFGAYNKNEPLPAPEIIGGIQEDEAKKIMQEFFKEKR